MLKRIQYLPAETANCAIHIILGTLPIESKLDTMVMSLYVRFLPLHASREKAIIMRQLSLKDLDSASWTQKACKILDKYELPTPYELLENPPPNNLWRKRVTKAVHHYPAGTGRTMYVHCTYSLGSHSWTYNVRTLYVRFRYAPCTKMEHSDYVRFRFR